jgi:hypothetical protein
MAATALFKEFGPFFNGGSLATSALIYHYVVGTTTTKACWTDRTKITTAAQPLQADINGIASAYFDGLYKIVVKTSDGATTLATWDQVQLLDPISSTPAQWTPTISCTTPGDLAVSYTSNSGYYDLAGNTLTAWFSIITSSFTYTTASGLITINNLPFTSSSSLSPWVSGAILFSGLTKAGYTNVVPIVSGGSLVSYLYATGESQPQAILAITDFPTGGNVVLQGYVTYVINA